jgi:hypothetical protein
LGTCPAWRGVDRQLGLHHPDAGVEVEAVVAEVGHHVARGGLFLDFERLDRVPVEGLNGVDGYSA